MRNDYLLELDNFLSLHNDLMSAFLREENKSLISEAIGEKVESGGKAKNLLSKIISKAIEIISSIIAHIISFFKTIFKEIRKKIKSVMGEMKEVKQRQVDFSGRAFIWKTNNLPKYEDFDKLNIDYLKASDPVSKFNELKDSVTLMVDESNPVYNKKITFSFRDYENFINYLTSVDPIIINLLKKLKEELIDLEKKLKTEDTKVIRIKYNESVLKMSAVSTFERFVRMAFVDLSFAFNQHRKFGKDSK